MEGIPPCFKAGKNESSVLFTGFYVIQRGLNNVIGRTLLMLSQLPRRSAIGLYFLPETAGSFSVSAGGSAGALWLFPLAFLQTVGS